MRKLVLLLNLLFLSACLAQDPNNANRQQNTNQQVGQQNPVRQKNRQSKSLEAQLVQEYQKHNQRIAILHRIKQLAQETNQPEKIKKADEIINLENKRHIKKITGIQQRPAAAPVKPETNQHQQ